MDFDVNIFEETLTAGFQEWDIRVSFDELTMMKEYAQTIIKVNQTFNLTRITESREMAIKNFLDSLSCLLLDLGSKLDVLDLGTGAGFPGIPLAIIKPEWSFVLLDSLLKRLNFLDETVKKLNLKNINTMHARAEDAGQSSQFRESFDLVVSRAVASLPVLLELAIPFVKIDGIFIAFKGNDAANELKQSSKALKELNCKVEQSFPLMLPLDMGERNLIVFRKIGATPRLYPRKSGTPNRKPLL